MTNSYAELVVAVGRFLIVIKLPLLLLGGLGMEYVLQAEDAKRLVALTEDDEPAEAFVML